MVVLVWMVVWWWGRCGGGGRCVVVWTVASDGGKVGVVSEGLQQRIEHQDIFV